MLVPRTFVLLYGRLFNVLRYIDSNKDTKNKLNTNTLISFDKHYCSCCNLVCWLWKPSGYSSDQWVFNFFWGRQKARGPTGLFRRHVKSKPTLKRQYKLGNYFECSIFSFLSSVGSIAKCQSYNSAIFLLPPLLYVLSNLSRGLSDAHNPRISRKHRKSCE